MFIHVELLCNLALELQERAESEHLFSSKEVEEEAKKESVKTFTPGEVPNIPEVAEEQQGPKVVAPTPEQIIAIKVLCSLHLST